MLGRITKQNVALVVRRTMTGIVGLIAVIAVIVVFGAVTQDAALAQTADLGLAEIGETSGLATTDIRVTIVRIIRAFFGLIGITLVVLMMYAGYLWMTSAGDDTKIATAKKIITRAVIGLFIIMSAYAIVSFILRAILNEQMPGGGIRSTSAITSLYGAGSGSHYLGSGIIEYHYPESGQTDVPRNTKVAITFKKPLVLSSIIEGYEDNGTYTLTDDTIGGVPAVPGTAYPLKVSNIKIIPNSGLGSPAGSSGNDAFDERYPDVALVSPVPSVSVTPVADMFDSDEGQTIVITFTQPIGSPTSNVNYRVALRGQQDGIRVWSEDLVTGEPFAENAFPTLPPDGAYFWPFATGTTLDITPPQVSGTVPAALGNPSSRPMDRNQLLQVYFNEAVDPTTASGITGALEDGGRGFTLLDVQARCRSGFTCDVRYEDDFVPLVGEWKLSNRYRTAEFIPAAECEGVTTNSCGERVYCLPRNVELRVVLRTPNLGSQPPAGIVPPNGIVDMVNNALDGNRNGTAEGPESAERPLEYSLNTPPTIAPDVNDDVLWIAHVGDTIDLVPPRVTDIIPKSFSSTSPPPSETTPFEAPDQGGPSLVPVDLDPTFVWSKVVSVGSLRTGGFDESTGRFADDRSTVVLRSYECVRDDGADCSEGSPNCTCAPLPPPSFFLDTELAEADGNQISILRLRHRSFLTGNDLGYTRAEVLLRPELTPKYQPVVRAKVKDTKQNCFFPSVGFNCAANPGLPSCCNRDAQGVFNCPL